MTDGEIECFKLKSDPSCKLYEENIAGLGGPLRRVSIDNITGRGEVKIRVSNDRFSEYCHPIFSMLAGLKRDIWAVFSRWRLFPLCPQEVGSQELYSPNFSGCIYYQRVFPDGNLDALVGTNRHSHCGPCEKCMLFEDTWKERVVDEIVIYNSGDLKVEFRHSWGYY